MGIINNFKIGVRRFFGVFGGSTARVDFNGHFNYWNSNSIYLDNIYNKIANDVALLKFRHVKMTDKDGLVTMENLNSDLQEVLTVSPNDYKTPITFWAEVVRRMLKDGIAVVVPSYDNGAIKSINLADNFEPTKSGYIAVTVGEITKELNINSVFIFENPKKNISAQLGQISKLIDENLRALSYKISQQGNSLKGFLKMPFSVNDDEMKQRANSRVADIMDVAKNSGIGYLDRQEDFQELSHDYNTASADELEFLKSQLYNAFGINENLFTCNYSEEQYRAYFSSVLKTYQRVISEEINRKYFSKTARTQGHKLLVYYDIFDISSLKDLNDFAFKQKYSGNLNSNEIRAILGYGGYPGGEIYETNKNAVQITENNEEINND